MKGPGPHCSSSIESWLRIQTHPRATMSQVHLGPEGEDLFPCKTCLQNGKTGVGKCRPKTKTSVSLPETQYRRGGTIAALVHLGTPSGHHFWTRENGPEKKGGQPHHTKSAYIRLAHDIRLILRRTLNSPHSVPNQFVASSTSR